MTEEEIVFGVPPSPAAIIWCFHSLKGPQEIFEKELAVAYLLMHEVVFINSAWYEKEWPKEARNSARLLCNCSDVFAWACSDAEAVEMGDIRAIYEHHRKDPAYGVSVWACKKRNKMPQPPLANLIKKAGLWDLDAMGLEPNNPECVLLRQEKS